jgi:hypothetical protein
MGPKKANLGRIFWRRPKRDLVRGCKDRAHTFWTPGTERDRLHRALESFAGGKGRKFARFPVSTVSTIAW